MLSSHVCQDISSGLLPSGCPTNFLHLPSPRVIHGAPILDFINLIMFGEEYKVPHYIIFFILLLPFSSVPLFFSTPCFETLLINVSFPQGQLSTFHTH